MKGKKEELVRVFWLLKKSQKRKVEKLAKKSGYSESEVVRNIISKVR